MRILCFKLYQYQSEDIMMLDRLPKNTKKRKANKVMNGKWSLNIREA